MINFVGMSKRSSGKIRGIQIANHLGVKFFDSSAVPVEDLEKIIILIRNQAGDFAKFLKSREHIIGYDLLDMPVGDLIFRQKNVDFSSYVEEAIDFYIVNNTYQKEELAKHTDSTVFIIPHHTVNFENIRSSTGAKAKRFGYVGLPSQIDSVKEIEGICNSLGAEFNIYNPKTREECVSCLSEIDVGIVYLDKNNQWYKEIINQKPATKLLNFQSFGIPTICTRYNSFKEFGAGANIFINDFNQLKNAIKMIIEDEDTRKEISDRGYENAQNYSIDKIGEYYKNIEKSL